MLVVKQQQRIQKSQEIWGVISGQHIYFEAGNEQELECIQTLTMKVSTVINYWKNQASLRSQVLSPTCVSAASSVARS